MKKSIAIILLCGTLTPAIAMGPMNMISPYIKGGVAINMNEESQNWPMVSGGVEISLPLIPVVPFVEAGYSWHSETVVENQTIAQSLIPISGGIKYKLVPLPFITPYLAVALSMNFYNYEFQGESSNDTYMGLSIRGGLSVTKLVLEIAYNKIFSQSTWNQLYIGGGIRL